MAQNTDIALTDGAWTQLTDADVSAIRVQNRSGYMVLLQATAAAVAPTSSNGCVEIESKEILAADITLAEIWPGVTGAARVWAWGSGVVSVSHA